MVTEERVEDRETAMVLPWDVFIRKEAERSVSNAEQRDLWIETQKSHIDGFRRVEWPNIVHSLRAEHSVVIPEGLEPHWAGAGKAVYWQNQTVRRGVTRKDAKGNTWRELEEVTLGWEPTNPLPANNAAQIAHYLGKGLRLRPPENGVDVEVLSEMPSSPSEPQPVPTVEYFCGRHPERGRMAWTSWKGYVQHTNRYGEVPDQEPPPDVMERRANNPFYCDVHDVTFSNERHASGHLNVVHKRQKQFPEMTIEMLRTGATNE